MLTDLHNHTFASFDGKQTLDELCRSSVSNGVEILGVCEHFDCDTRGGMTHFPNHFSSWIDEIKEAKEKYAGKLEILQGIELGQPHVFLDEAKAMLAKADYDLVIGSMHDLSGERDIYDVKDGKVNADRFFEEYFTETLTMLKTGIFDVLGHMDYPVRKLEISMGGNPSLKRWESLIKPCLCEMADRGVALELNTVLMRYWAKCFGLEPWLLAEYKKVGGERVTVAGDGHMPKYDNFGVLEAHKYLKENGFDKVTVFKARKAEFIPINI